MAKVIAIHSFRGGTGKSNITASLAALLARHGQRVGTIDADIQSPGIHVLFGMDDALMPHSLNHYLWGKCDIQEAAYDITPNLGAELSGRIFLIPSSTNAGEITRILREGYDVGLLNDGLRRLVDDLNLDVLMIDTHPGLNEETLLSMALCDTLAIILRPDQQDYQGTSVTVEVARRLGATRMLLIINKVPSVFDPDTVKARVEQTYDCKVAAVLPHCDELMVLGSTGVFALRYPDHPLTTALQAATIQLVGD